MASAWALGGLTWKELATRVWAEMNKDDVFGRAAQLSYYFLLALFPLLLFLTSMLGYFAGAGTELREELLTYLGQVVPAKASTLIRDTVTEISEGSSGGKLSLGLLAALWAASNGMGAISASLNAAYGIKESRPWWRERLSAIFLTIVLAVLIISALALMLYGHDIAEAVADWFGLGRVFTIVWMLVQWPIVLAFVLLAFGLIYYFAPDLHDQHWVWVTPGSAIGVVLWLVVSFAFKTYLEFFDSYNATYGSLGAVIILMLWFYLTGMAILIGGEVNSEIENAAAAAGDPTAKPSGDKQPTSQESVAADSSSSSKTSSGSGGPSRKARAPQISPARGAQAYRGGKSNSGTNRKESLGFRKIAVVFGAWFWSKLRAKH